MKLLEIFRKRPASHKIPIIHIGTKDREYEIKLARIGNQCIVMGLKQLIEGKYFNICAVDDLCKASKIRIDAEAYDYLRCIHCVNWNQMPNEMREDIVQFLIEVFSDEIKPTNQASSPLPTISKVQL